MIKGLCLLKVAVDGSSVCVDNTLVCVGILLGVGVLPERKYRLVLLVFVIPYKISVIKQQVLVRLEYQSVKGLYLLKAAASRRGGV